MTRICMFATMMIAAVLMTGCMARTAVVSHKGQAYVTKGSMFGTSMYYCDATAGPPECWKVTEHAVPGGGQ